MSTDTSTQTATDPAAGLADHHYPKAYRQLLGYVDGHDMTVLHEDGLYRHIRFATPGTSIGSFDLVTWPGHLAISGDLGSGWTFRREEDMFAWFANTYRAGYMVPAGHINPSYWSEKLAGSRRDYEGFSEDKFTADVNAMVDSAITRHALDDGDAAELRQETQDEVLDHAHSYDTNSAYDVLSSFRPEALDFGGSRPTLTNDVDPEVWDDCDHHFLMACHAILWGVRKYLTETSS
ncbi:hypothetical protein [Ornithinimicrobium murale]|uniref:hypothetical protein n=1 Tax=Ornithinimicrobium murale TaxID=1050153 RepID=UPI0013B38F71|nr:hypothetical protein [Ornithinimicrobium murale]